MPPANPIQYTAEKMWKDQLDPYLPLVQALANIQGVQIRSLAHFVIPLTTEGLQVSPGQLDGREEKTKINLFFGWENIQLPLNTPRIVSLLYSTYSPHLVLSALTISAVDAFLKSLFPQLHLPPLPIRPVLHNLRVRYDLGGWYDAGGWKSHRFSFLQDGSGLPTAASVCRLKVPFYELAARQDTDLQTCCKACLVG